jgi:hypothetical protein
MRNIRKLACSVALPALLVAGPAAAAEIFDIGKRQVVDMPPNVPPVLRGEMVTFLGVLRDVQSLSAQGKFAEAGDLVERQMGRSAMGQHAGGVRPGMFMPPAMHAIARSLHQLSSDWAVALKSGDRAKSDAAMAQVFGACAGCHQAFQIK